MKMKSIFVAFAAMLCLTANAQEENEKMPEYTRPSLYTIMIPDTDMTAEEQEQMKAAFSGMAIPDKYNDFNLETRSIDLGAISVTPEEIANALGTPEGESKGKGMMKILGKMAVGAAAGAAGGKVSEKNEIVAKLNKYFAENYTANNLLAKWFSMQETPYPSDDLCAGCYFNYDNIYKYGALNLTKEEEEKAKASKDARDAMMTAAANEIVPKTFVMVTKYSILTAEEIIEMTFTAAQLAAQAIPNALAQQAAILAAEATKKAMAAKLKGYFVSTKSYLYQLEFDQTALDGFYKNYFVEENKTAEFMKDAQYKLKFVDVVSNRAPAALSMKAKNFDKLLARATVRATDGAIAKLQRKHDDFRTVSTVYLDGKQAYAYIGLKEGVKAGDKFDVLANVVDKKTGKRVWEPVASLSIDKKTPIWDNRAGADEVLEGAAPEEEEVAGDGATEVKYTLLKGSTKKILEGMVIKQKGKK